MTTPPSASARDRLPACGCAALLAVLAGCGSGAPRLDTDDAVALVVGAAVAAEATPVQDLLVWAEQDGARSTLWVRGSALGSEVVAVRPGLLIPAGDALFEWRETAVELPLCDCDRFDEAGREGPCPATDEPATARRVALVDLVSGDEIELLPVPAIDPSVGPELVDYRGTAAPLATVGPYVFVRHGVETLTCGAAHNSWSGGFTIYDLDRRAPTELLDATDRERIAAAERDSAFQLFAGDTLAEAARPDDLELTVIEPAYVPGLGLTLTYQFTADASFADSDDNWGAYSRSVRVGARTLPTALVPFAPLPPALQNLVLTGDDVRVGGWAPVAGTAAMMAVLLGAFGDAGTAAD